MEDISWLAIKDGLTSIVWMIDNSLLVLADAVWSSLRALSGQRLAEASDGF
jgi:hypothetical protein